MVGTCNHMMIGSSSICGGGPRLIAKLANILPITVYDTYDELVFMGFISQQTMPGGAHCIYI